MKTMKRMMKILALLLMVPLFLTACWDTLEDISDSIAETHNPVDEELYIGMPYQGGIIAYIYKPGDTGYVPGQVHGIIAAEADQSTGIEWGGHGANMSATGYTTGTALGDGASNTATIVNFFEVIYQSGNPAVTYYTYDWPALTSGTVPFTDGSNTYAMDYRNDGTVAAKLCDDYTNTDTGTGVYSDWYLPSKDELNKLYLNKDSVGGFAADEYLSSSEETAYHAWIQHFDTGSPNYRLKSLTHRVRAVRAF